MKKILRGLLLLTIWMVLCLVPFTANAEGENPIELTQANYKDYFATSLDAWRTLYLKPGSYILTENITLDAELYIGYYGQDKDEVYDVTLDLNGYVLCQGADLVCAIRIYPNNTLTIEDSRPEAVHRFTADSTGLWQLDEENGNKTVNGGIITGANRNGLALQPTSAGRGDINAKCVMNGGNIVGCTSNIQGGGVYVGTGAVFTLNGGSIRGCTVTDPDHGFGGAVFVVGSTFNMNGGVISDCIAASGGDALYVTDDNEGHGRFSMSTSATINGSLKDDNPGASEGSLGVYIVTFDSNGGSPVPSQVRPQSATAVKPDDPTRDGWVFAGWYIGENAYDFMQPVTENLTLTAKWIPHSHCLCGGNTDIGDHTAHTDVTWAAWTATDKLPDMAGNYYLVYDVTLPDGTATLPGGVNLCLNGRAVKGAGTGTELIVDGMLTVTDCGTTGSFGELAVNDTKATLTMYNGKITSGIFNGEVINNGRITGGTFYGTVSGYGSIEDSAKVAVNFDSDGGSAVDTQKVLRGQKAVEPEAPARIGYIFSNWTIGGAAFDFTASVVDDITLTAAWTLCDHSVSTAQPTCTEQATCTVCKGKYGNVLGHSYGAPVYTWNGTSCTAERVCGRDTSHKETETVTAAITVTQTRACTLDELSTYTAVFTNAAFATQKQENVKTADKLGHDFTVRQYDETQHWNKCSRCDETDAKENHSIDGAVCTVCGKHFDETRSENTSPAPSIIEGMNGTWNKGSESGLTFRSDAAYAEFIAVLVDGTVISADNYTKREGSTIVEVKASYLVTLAEGEHTLIIRSAGGDAAAKFTVTEKVLSPQTGWTDEAWNWGYIIAAAILSIICAMAAVFVIRRRKAA